VPGRTGDKNGFTPEDWLPNQLALTATRPFQADPSNSLTTLGTVTGCQWRFVDLDVEHIIIGVTPSGRSARSTWRLKKGDQDTFHRVVEATRKQRSQPQGESRHRPFELLSVGVIAEEVEEAK